MPKRKPLIFARAAFLAFPAFAGPATDALGACLADNTSGKERKELAKWIFVGMAAHPEIQDIAKLAPAVHEQTDREIGDLVGRLLIKNCADQARAAINGEGGSAF